MFHCELSQHKIDGTIFVFLRGISWWYHQSLNCLNDIGHFVYTLPICGGQLGVSLTVAVNCWVGKTILWIPWIGILIQVDRNEFSQEITCFGKKHPIVASTCYYNLPPTKTSPIHISQWQYSAYTRQPIRDLGNPITASTLTSYNISKTTRLYSNE